MLDLDSGFDVVVPSGGGAATCVSWVPEDYKGRLSCYLCSGDVLGLSGDALCP